jgi:NAD(P)-dependent dehydrogenase (short-subunit alcohol dehydrogenase family)
MVEKDKSRHALGRVGDVYEVARTIAFLGSYFHVESTL